MIYLTLLSKYLLDLNPTKPNVSCIHENVYMKKYFRNIMEEVYFRIVTILFLMTLVSIV